MTVITSSQDLARDLAAVEQQLVLQGRERNTLQTQLAAALVQPADGQLSDARQLRDSINKLSAEIDLLNERHRALTSAADEARRRDVAESWAIARRASEAAADKLRAAVKKYQEHVDQLIPLAEKVLAEDDEWIQTLMPANASRPEAPISTRLSRLTLLRLYMLTNGRMRVTGVMESPYEMERSGRADFLLHTQNVLVPAMRVFDSPPAGALPPKVAA